MVWLAISSCHECMILIDTQYIYIVVNTSIYVQHKFKLNKYLVASHVLLINELTHQKADVLQTIISIICWLQEHHEEVPHINHGVTIYVIPPVNDGLHVVL